MKWYAIGMVSKGGMYVLSGNNQIVQAWKIEVKAMRKYKSVQELSGTIRH